MEPGRSSAGLIEVVDIGIPQSVIDEVIPDADRGRGVGAIPAPHAADGRAQGLGRPRPRRRGSAGMIGAPALACEAALRVGAGT